MCVHAFVQLVLGADMGQRLRLVHTCIRRLMDTGAALLAHCSDTEAGRPYTQQVRAKVGSTKLSDSLWAW